MTTSITGTVQLNSFRLGNSSRFFVRNLGSSMSYYSPGQVTIASSGMLVHPNDNGDLGAMAQAINNASFSLEFTSNASQGLGLVSDIVDDIYTKVAETLAARGTAGFEQVAQANQASIDESVKALVSAAENMKFNGRRILAGEYGFFVSSKNPELKGISLISLTQKNGYPQEIEVFVSSPAERAEAGQLAESQTHQSRVSMTGELGSAEFFIPSGATRGQIDYMINDVSSMTGVESEDGNIRSVFYGSSAFVTINITEGTLSGISSGSYRGEDVQGMILSTQASGFRNVLAASSDEINAIVTVDPETKSGIYSFRASGGVRFNSGSKYLPESKMLAGLGPIFPSLLGDPGGAGSLASLVSGGGNEPAISPLYAFTAAENAKTQADEMKMQFTSLRELLFKTNYGMMTESFSKIIEGGGPMMDGDIAKNMMDSLKTGILRNSTAALYGSSPASFRSVMRLLI